MMKRFTGYRSALGLGKLSILALLGLSLLQAAPARADFIDGNQLRLYCTSKNPSDEAVCFVYIAGAVDAFTTIDLMGQKTRGAAPRFCLPDTAGPDQLKDVTLAWLERPETDLEFAATLLIWGAVSDAYGCAN